MTQNDQQTSTSSQTDSDVRSDGDWIEEEYGPDAPTSPSDPRPNDEPYFIDSECKFCGAKLVLVDDPDEDDVVWYDEFECPECMEGVYMDWPDEHKQHVNERVAEAAREEDFMTDEEVKESLDI
jgi:hypothetical protein